MEFSVLEECSLDANGRLKLPADVQRDFRAHSEDSVILYCLPEGAIGVFPPDHWATIRQKDHGPLDRFASDVVFRRTLRRFGSMSQSTKLSGQGRITLPTRFREYAKLDPGKSVIVAGCEIGIEIWLPSLWERELGLIHQHIQAKGDSAMLADLNVSDSPSGHG